MNFMYAVGVHEVPADIARALISSGLARPFKEVEKKVIKRGQKAVINVLKTDNSTDNRTNKPNRSKAAPKGKRKH